MTILNLDGKSGAIIIGGVYTGISATGSSNCVLKGVELQLSGLNLIEDAHGLVFEDRCHIHGDPSLPSTGWPQGLDFHASSAMIRNCEIDHFGDFAIRHRDCNGFKVQGNSFHDIRCDAIHGQGTSNMHVLRNTFTDFWPTGTPDQGGDHPDAIQFYTDGQTASAMNIHIGWNLIMRGNGGGQQGIFVQDDIGGRPFLSLSIHNNLIIGGSPNGLMVRGAKAPAITGNIVVGLPPTPNFSRKGPSGIHLFDTPGAILSGNQAEDFSQDGVIPDAWPAGVVRLPQPSDGGAALRAVWAKS